MLGTVNNYNKTTMYNTSTLSNTLKQFQHFIFRYQLAIKIAVYSLLTINFFIYIYQDIANARATLPDNYGFIELAASYTTSIDYFAWLLLIVIFELETYAVSDEAWNKKWKISLRVLRVFCYALLAHTVLSYSGALFATYTEPFALANTLGACDFADQDMWWLHILSYTEITSQNCSELQMTNLWQTSTEGVITNEQGIFWEAIFAHVDLLEITSWLMIMAAIEVNVAYAMKGQTDHSAAKIMRILSTIGYVLIFVFSLMWIWAGFPEYAWDEFVWITGFAVIEMNISEWQEEIEESDEKADSQGLNGTA